MGYFSYELGGNEKVLMLVRKHWITLALPVLRSLVLIVIVLYIREKVLEFSYGKEFIIILIITLILYIVHEFLTWQLDSFIITDRRIIDIDQKNMFKRIVAEIGIENVQEVVYEINGPLEAIFNFGTLKVKTASSGSIIGMEKIPNPIKVKELILNI